MRAIGRFRLHTILDGFFGLDGGAMFGIVPKPLWEKQIPADERNRIRLALRCLLVVDGARRILIDDGIGDQWTEKETAIYAIDRTPSVDGALAAAGFSREEVSDLVLTHLHFDHAGGTTRRVPGGGIELSFPNATCHVQRRNWEWAHSPTERDAGSYLASRFERLERSGRLHLLDGEAEIVPGFRVVPSEGHTTGLQTAEITGGDETLVFCADLIPTTAHLKASWNMGYDLRPLDLLREKKALLSRAIRGGFLLFFEHDPRIAAARVSARPDGALHVEAVDV